MAKPLPIVVLGSSPTAPLGLQRVPKRRIVFTTNAGLKLVERPHTYLIHDPRAASKFRHMIVKAHKLGTRVVRSKLDGGAWPKFVPHDEQISCTTGSAWDANRFVSPGVSGWITAQLAVLAGPQRIYLVGMEGHTSTWERLNVETFDGRLGHRLQRQRTLERVGPFARSLMLANPQIMFVFVGTPIYWDKAKTLNNVHGIAVEQRGKERSRRKAKPVPRLGQAKTTTYI